MNLVTRRARRLGAGTALTAVVAALVFAAGVAPAQAAPETPTISNASLTVVYVAEERKMRLEFDVSFSDPVNGSGGVFLGYSSPDTCNSVGYGSIQRVFTGNTHYSETFIMNPPGYWVMDITPFDSNHQPTTNVTSVWAGDITVADAPTAELTVDASGTSGVISVTTTNKLKVYGITYGTGETPTINGDMGDCTTKDFPFSGLGSGERFSVVSTDLDGLVLAEYTAPIIPPTQSPTPVEPPKVDAPKADPTKVLPATGSTVTLPIGAASLLLFAGASVMAVASIRRRRPSNR